MAISCLPAIVLLVAGCYRKPTYTPPETYPVTGKVVSTSGKMLTGSLIKFVPPDGQLVGEGNIQADGSFSLRTLFHEQWLEGAVEGADCRVEILVPLGADRLGGQTIHVQQKYTIEAKENNFTVTLE
ncbi:MAG: hypothetical protein JXM70_22270 [Pirellulales bacterium]|nr:hypothetical protein [Pirellulales bacterium]